MSQNLKTGDLVKVIAGDHKGQTAKIIKMLPTKNQALLEGLGVRERHIKATAVNPKGGKKTVHLGIHLSNLQKVEGK